RLIQWSRYDRTERDRSGDLRADRLAAGRRRPNCELHPSAARDEGRSAAPSFRSFIAFMLIPHIQGIIPPLINNSTTNPCCVASPRQTSGRAGTKVAGQETNIHRPPTRKSRDCQGSARADSAG